MKGFYRFILWIDLAFALIGCAAFLRGLSQRDGAFAAKSLLAISIWLGFAWFCYGQLTKLKTGDEAMLAEFRQLGYQEALAKAHATAIPLPRALVVEKIARVDCEWHAFERKSVQFVIAKSNQGNRAEVWKI